MYFIRTILRCIKYYIFLSDNSLSIHLNLYLLVSCYFFSYFISYIYILHNFHIKKKRGKEMSIRK